MTAFDTINNDIVEELPSMLPPKSNSSHVLDFVLILLFFTPLCHFHIDFVMVLPQLNDTSRVVTFLSQAIIRLHIFLSIFDCCLLTVVTLF